MGPGRGVPALPAPPPSKNAVRGSPTVAPAPHAGGGAAAITSNRIAGRRCARPIHRRPHFPSMPNSIRSTRAEPPYRFGFILNTSVGNMTRYQNLRKYAERDPEVAFTWAPVTHYIAPGSQSRLRFLPHALFMRALVMQQTWPVLGRLDRFDAVMVHLFEADVMCSLRGCLLSRPIHFSSTDEAPITDRSTYPMYPAEAAKPWWRHRGRLALDRWRVRHTDHFVPFTQWGAEILIGDCGAPRERVHPVHVGMDLELWRSPAKQPRRATDRLKMLFVGGDFIRKGGALLLDVYSRHFQNVAELHLVTRQAPAALPAGVQVHDDFEPNDERLRRLYAEVDVLVVPSTADLIPWVFLEALTMRVPVIATRIGATSEVVHDGETGFTVPVNDGEALRQAIQRIVDDHALAWQMGERGRALIEARYDAAKNVPAILQTMKDATDRERDRNRSKLR
jgi:glycosyltransferase involved in cell wall biosynthesis